jgi:hypothetical protein
LAAAVGLTAILLLPVEPAEAQNWSLTGNAGTVAGFNFVGTTDLSPMIVKAHGRRVIRLEPAIGNANGDFAPNVIEGDRVNSIKSGVQGRRSAVAADLTREINPPIRCKPTLVPWVAAL